MPTLYSLENIDARAYDSLAFYNVIGTVGCAFWVIAYALVIHKGFRDRAYGLPLVAICLNFSWELLASFVFPVPVPLWLFIYRSWLVVDVVIFWQLLRYGPELQKNPLVRRFFYPVVAVTLLLGLTGQYTFVATYEDRLGFVVAFGINLIMSILFNAMYFSREGGRGLSLPAAWLKMLGTLGTSIQCYHIVPMMNPERPTTSFFTFIAVSIFLFDCVYIYLLTTRPPAKSVLRAAA